MKKFFDGFAGVSLVSKGSGMLEPGEECMHLFLRGLRPSPGGLF